MGLPRLVLEGLDIFKFSLYAGFFLILVWSWETEQANHSCLWYFPVLSCGRNVPLDCTALLHCSAQYCPVLYDQTDSLSDFFQRQGQPVR